jgi:hypothetical protein
MDTLFHYTSEEAARSIIEDEEDFGLYFQVGVGNWHGHGLYATDIAPVDRESMDDVSTRCFGGGATHPELNHVLVLLPDNAEHRFVRTGNPDEWIISVPQALEIIRLETLLLAIRRFDGVGWTTIWGNECFEGVTNG